MAVPLRLLLEQRRREQSLNVVDRIDCIERKVARASR